MIYIWLMTGNIARLTTRMKFLQCWIFVHYIILYTYTSAVIKENTFLFIIERRILFYDFSSDNQSPNVELIPIETTRIARMTLQDKPSDGTHLDRVVSRCTRDKRKFHLQEDLNQNNSVPSIPSISKPRSVGPSNNSLTLNQSSNFPPYPTPPTSWTSSWGSLSSSNYPPFFHPPPY